jgi:hypothetical protein
MTKVDPQKEFKNMNIFEKILKSITNKRLMNQGRPKDIPPLVPDCGWNHGEGKEK